MATAMVMVMATAIIIMPKVKLFNIKLYERNEK